jgi:hypothetical protein
MHRSSPLTVLTRLTLFCLALFCLSFLTATAATAATRDEQTQACRGDAMRLCSAEIPNEDKITACMKKNISQLSPGCKAMFHQGSQGKQSAAASRKTKQQ